MEKSKKTWSFQEVLPDLKVIMEMFLCVPDERLFSFIQAVRLGPVVYASFVVTGRNEVVAKIMFLHLSVILFTGGSASVHAGIPPPRRHAPPSPEARTPRKHTPPPPGKHAPHPTPPPEADSGIRSMSGRYGSYWNAFLFYLCSDYLCFCPQSQLPHE